MHINTSWTSHHTLRGRAARGLLAAFACMLIASPARAASWSSQTALTVAPSSQVTAVDVAGDSAGNMYCAWTQSDGTNLIVYIARRDAATGTWSAPIFLSSAGQDASAPRIAIDPNRNVFVAWRRFSGASYIVQSATRSAATGSWSATEDISATGQNAEDPDIAADGLGNAYLVWTRSNGTHTIVQAAIRSAITGTWSAPSDVSAAGQNAFGARAAADAAGNAYLGWYRSNGSENVVQASYRAAADSSWGSPATVSVPGQAAGDVQIAASAAGRAFLIWSRPSGGLQRVQSSAWSSASSTWGTPDTISSGTGDARLPRIAVDSAGNATAVWVEAVGAFDAAEAARRSVSSGTWETPNVLSDVNIPAQNPRIAMSPAGDAHVVWHRFNGVSTVVEASNRAVGAAGWSAASAVSPSGTNTALAGITVDGLGNTVAVWRRYTTDYIVEAILLPGDLPAVSTAPSLTGTPKVGKLLACRKGTWTGTATITYSYQWQRKIGTTYHAISGATAYRYRLVRADAGRKVRCRVIAMNGQGAVTRFTAAVRVPA